jgi:hypothetical protein
MPNEKGSYLVGMWQLVDELISNDAKSWRHQFNERVPVEIIREGIVGTADPALSF